jgi:hypothetical protein
VVKAQPMTRLQRFRAFIAEMNPSSNPGEAIEQGYYVDPPDGGVWSQLTKKLELEPASTHLVLGGIGSGKSSELLRAYKQLRASLRENGDFVRYCDVSKSHDLSASPRVGVLFALASLKLMSRASTRKGVVESPAASALEGFARGSVVWVDPHDYDYDEEAQDHEYDDVSAYHEAVFRPGVLKAPSAKPIDWHLSEQVPHLRTFLAHYPGTGHAAVMLFDSLDRLPEPAAFKQMVEDDIRALKSAGIGTVVVGPVRFIVGNDRSLADLFDHVHFQLAHDPRTEAGETFLCEVLRRRVEVDGLLSEECFPLLAQASGGVLRDLIALAKRSAEEAYANGHPKILPEDIARASEAFGRSLAIGLDDEQLQVLEKVAQSGSFIVRGERELSLLETRRVLLHPNNRWAVHPTLQALIGSHG